MKHGARRRKRVITDTSRTQVYLSIRSYALKLVSDRLAGAGSSCVRGSFAGRSASSGAGGNYEYVIRLYSKTRKGSVRLYSTLITRVEEQARLNDIRVLFLQKLKISRELDFTKLRVSKTDVS